MHLQELEVKLRQCGREKESANFHGSNVLDGAKDLQLENNSVVDSEAGSYLIAPLVSQSDVQPNLPNDNQTTGLNDMNNENRFDFMTSTVETEAPMCSLFLTWSAGSPSNSMAGLPTPKQFCHSYANYGMAVQYGYLASAAGF